MILERDEKVKQVVEKLKKQYETEKYGTLHRALSRKGIHTDLYIGIGIEMHYPDAYDTLFSLHVFDEDDLLIVDRRESCDDSTLQRTLKIVRSLGYKVKSFDELTEEEQEYYFA